MLNNNVNSVKAKSKDTPILSEARRCMYKEKECRDCGTVFTPWQHNQIRCGKCVQKQGTKYKGQPPLQKCPTCDKEFTRRTPRQKYCSKECGGTQRSAYIQSTYGITPRDYNKMLEESGGVCEICGTNPKDLPKNRQHLCVDHDHETGEIRGLLCHHCNTGLGQFRDDVSYLKSAIRYLTLERATTIPTGSTSDKDADGSALHPTKEGDDIV